MIIEEKKVTIRELAEGYLNNDEEGVTGYAGRLDIRPKYQREFVYKDAQRDEVIKSVTKDLPLNVFYWAKTDKDKYEILDGQQRTISICEYVDGNFSVDSKYFYNLPEDQKNQILDYKLFIYVCDGTDSEKLEWFKIINIAGEQLTDQELRNAVYAGPWTTDAKKYFSKSNGPAQNFAGDYLKGKRERQDYLETAIKWAASKEGTSIEKYMAKRQYTPTAQELWSYFRSVIEWTKAIFPNYRKEMKVLPWGEYYNEHGARNDLNPDVLEEKIKTLYADPDVTRKAGIYLYLLTGEEKELSIRKFNEREKRDAYEKQDHKCAGCSEEFEYSEMHGDHIKPWSKGGRTVPDNCQMLCTMCNLKKSNH